MIRRSFAQKLVQQSGGHDDISVRSGWRSGAERLGAVPNNPRHLEVAQSHLAVPCHVDAGGTHVSVHDRKRDALATPGCVGRGQRGEDARGDVNPARRVDHSFESPIASSRPHLLERQPLHVFERDGEIVPVREEFFDPENVRVGKRRIRGH
jgi:hypothetical protein